VPFAAIEVTLRVRWPEWNQNLYDDWASLLVYATFFIYGYLLFSDARFGQAIRRHGETSLALGIVSLSAIAALGWTGLDTGDGYSIEYVIYEILHSFSSWFWIIAILSFGQRYLRFSNPMLRYGNEAVLPFYILHQTAIVIIGFYVLRVEHGGDGEISCHHYQHACPDAGLL